MTALGTVARALIDQGFLGQADVAAVSPPGETAFLASNTAGLLAGLTPAQAAALLGISSTLQGNGILRLPLGFILQWGLSANQNAGEYSHAFPVAFPNECLCGLASISHGSSIPANTLYTVSCDSFAPNSMAFRKRKMVNNGPVQSTTDGFEIRWIAIGR